MDQELDITGSWEGMPPPGNCHRFNIAVDAIPSGFPTGRPDRPGEDEPLDPPLRVTLALSPTSDPCVQGFRVAMSEWPEQLEALLTDPRRGFSILVAPKDDTGRPVVDLRNPIRSIPARRVLRDGETSLHGGDAGRIRDLWSRLMAPNVTPVETAASYQRWDPWRSLDMALLGWTGGESGRLVLPTMRCEAALLATLKRAGNVLQRVAVAEQTTLPDSHRLALLRESDLDAPSSDGQYRAWLEPRRHVEVAALNVTQGTFNDGRLVSPLARDVTAEAMAGARERAARFEAACRDFCLATTPEGRTAAIGTIGRIVAERAKPADIAKAVGDRDRRFLDTIQDKVDAAHLELTKAALADESPDRVGPKKLDQIEAARRRFYGLQALPMMARIFNFAVEVEVSASSVAAALPGIDLAKGFFVAAVPTECLEEISGAGHLDSGLTWTATKYVAPTSYDDDLGVTGHFWPCELFELLGGTKDLRFVDGLVQLGGKIDDVPRFEMLSVDVVGSVAGSLQQRIWDEDQRRHLDPSLPGAGRKAEAAGASGDPMPRLTLRTAGLALVDNFQATASAGEASAFDQSVDLPRVNGARELTTGYRLDIGTRRRIEEDIEWRSLNNRRIDFHDPRPGSGDWLMRVADRLGLSTVDRIRLDANSINAPQRELDPPSDIPGETPSDSDNDHPPRSEVDDINGALSRRNVAMAEELLAVWQGDPLGVECRESTVAVPAETDLAIGQRIRPISTATDQRRLTPPPLRFGKEYHFGMRPVYLAGVVMPLHEAQDRYQRAASDLVIPAKTQAGRRFLRLERIDAPMLTLPESLVRTQHSAGRYPIDAAGSAILRTVTLSGRPQNDRATNRNRRVLVAPSVALDFAALHGAFDRALVVSGTRATLSDTGTPCATDNVRQPRDGLANVRYAAEPRGGFPVIVADAFVESSSELVTDLVYPYGKGASPPDPVTAGLRRIRGDAVFDVKETLENTGATRPLPYYPDPAASFMVIGARRRIGSSTFLPGSPRCIPLYRDGRPFPDAMPVVIEFTKASQRPPDVTVTQEVVISAATPGYLDLNEAFHPGPPPAGVVVPVQQIIISLAPGEDFDIVCWCSPTGENLENWFEICESLGVLGVQRGGDPDNPDQSCQQGWSQLAPAAGQTILNALEAEAHTTPAANRCPPAGLALPTKPMLRAIATTIVGRHQREPISEIAAPRIFRAVHAISQPAHAPTINLSDVRLVRRTFKEGPPPASPESLEEAGGTPVPALVDAGSQDALADPAPPPPPSAGAGEETRDEFLLAYPAFRWPVVSGPWNHDGATDVMVGGRIGLDLHTSHSVDLVCTTASPGSPKLDDPLRVRRPSDPAATFYEEYAAVGTDVGRREALARRLRRTYGFDIDLGTDMVTLVRNDVVLATIEARRPKDAVFAWGNEWVDILIDGKTPRRMPARFAFTDSLARRFTLSLEARGRFDDVLKHKRDVGREGMSASAQGLVSAEETSGKVLGFETGRVPKEFVSVRSEAAGVDIWCPATIRPSRIEPKSILPAFVWSTRRSRASGDERDVTTVTRSSVVRFRFKRPWFSSGEGEQLGIVLWPPDLFSRSRAALAQNIVPAPDCDPKESLALANPLLDRIALLEGALRALPMVLPDVRDRTADLQLALDDYITELLADDTVVRDPQSSAETTHYVERLRSSFNEMRLLIPEIGAPEVAIVMDKLLLLRRQIVPDAGGLCLLPQTETSFEGDFSDLSLGPGGPFVTRWGADPIRKSPTADGWFMPRDAFPEARGEFPENLVAQVRMPVPRGRSDGAATESDTGIVAAETADVEPRDRPNNTLLVSLLVYTPKFDIDAETWYVDVKVDSLDLAYPFVRFGLVRYQPHAPEHLRVSEPVAAWTQIVPTRTVDIGVTPGDGGYSISVAVRGRASIRSAPLPEDRFRTDYPASREPEDPRLEPRHRPVVTMKVMRRDAAPGRPAMEEIVAGLDGLPLEWDSQSQSGEQPRQVNEGLTWEHTFMLPDDPEHPPEGVTYSVFIEEVEYMLPGAYRSEEGQEFLRSSQSTPPILEKTGPRFATRVLLGS